MSIAERKLPAPTSPPGTTPAVPLADTAAAALANTRTGLRAGVARAWTIPPVRLGFAGAVAMTLGSYAPAFLPPDNYLQQIPGIALLQTRPGAIVAFVVLLVGLAAVVRAWIALRPRPGADRLSGWVLAIWSAPMMLAAPLFSRDAYSYAAQGNLVRLGIDPYAFGPGAIWGGFTSNVDPVWEFTPAPYGPLSLRLQELVVTVIGEHPLATAVAMRLIAVAGVVLIAVCLPRIGRALNLDEQQTIWLGVLNPLLLMHLVGGSHNDSLAIGLMLAGILLAQRGGWWLACVAIAAAAAVKQPAIAALLVVGVYAAIRRHGSRPTVRQCVAPVLAAAATGLVAFVAITLATGLGFGWIDSMGAPGEIRSFLAPGTILGELAQRAVTGEWLGAADDSVLSAVQTAVFVAGAIAAVVICLRLAPSGPVRALGWALAVITVTAPVVHPWYLLWPMLLLMAADPAERVRTGIVWVTVGLAAYSVVASASSNSTLGIIAMAGVLVAGRYLRRHLGSNDAAPEHRNRL